MSSMVDSSMLDAARDPAIDRRTRGFLKELNKDSSPFWELPGDEPRSVVTKLQSQTPVECSGVEIDQRPIAVNGRTIALYAVRPEGVTGTIRVFMFFHGAVWMRVGGRPRSSSRVARKGAA